jgi:hypothetical protein
MNRKGVAPGLQRNSFPESIMIWVTTRWQVSACTLSHLHWTIGVFLSLVIALMSDEDDYPAGSGRRSLSPGPTTKGRMGMDNAEAL